MLDRLFKLKILATENKIGYNHTMSGIKDFFVAGIMVEEAKEKRDAARTQLREAAAQHCPQELSALDAASAALEAAEKRAGEVFAALVRGTGDDTQIRRALEEHLKTCDNPSCPLRAINQTEGAKPN
jgi:hypothetical protein